MTVRIRAKHDEHTRQTIKVTQIINRLTNHMNGECDMSNSQIKAAEILLKKALPDLQAVSVTTEDEEGNKIPLNVNVVFKHVNVD